MEATAKLFQLTIIVTWWCVTSTYANLSRDEVETVFSSLRLFKTGKCILTLETDDDGTAKDMMKDFAGRFLATAFMTLDTLEDFVERSTPPHQTTAIAIKVNSTTTVKKLLVENANRLHWFLWFLIAEDDLDPEIRIPLNCQLFHIRKGSSRTHRLIEYYQIKNSSTHTQDFGSWTPEQGLKTSSVNISRRRTNLLGILLKITVCHIYTVEKSIESFWEDSGTFLNYTLQKEPKRVNKTPITLDDHDGTSCISAITALDYEKDWIFWSFGNKVRLLTKFRGTNEVGWRAYVQPFTGEMWVAVGAWLLLSTVAIVIVNGCSIKVVHNNIFTAFFCLCISDPMTVHPPTEPLPLPTKLVYFMSLAVPAVIVPAYSAYILSTLSVTRPFEPFYDMKGFIEDGTYRMTAATNTFSVRYLQGSKDKDLKYIYDNLFEGANNQAPTLSAFFERLCKNNKLVGLFVDLRTIRRQFRCQMYVAPQVVLTISTGLLLPKGSPLRKVLNERINEYHETGIKRRSTSAEPFFKDSFEEEAGALHSLNMSQMQALFIIVPFGIVLSLIVLAVEVAAEKRSKRRRTSSGSTMEHRATGTELTTSCNDDVA